MLDRRQFLRVCAGSGAIVFSDRLRAGQEQTEGRLAFRLKETAGLRRFHYPVHAVLPVTTSHAGLGYRLVRDGKEVPAQFCRANLKEGVAAVTLDFTASPGPFEAEDYTIEFGPGVKPGDWPSRGLVSEREDGIFRVSNPPFLTYSIPDDLSGLVSSIKTPNLEFLDPASRGLFLVDRGHRTRTRLKFAGDGSAARWSRRGPFAVGLRFEGMITTSNRVNFRTTVDLTFVHSKSWIETNWTVEDPECRIDTMGVDLEMKLDGTPALVDCGASSTVYSHLQAGETLLFTARPPSNEDRRPRWTIEQGPATGRRPFAIAASNDRPSEGWIHLMDRSRCSALAVADFASLGADQFLIESTGRMEFERRFPIMPTPLKSTCRKTLRFWLHVVPVPVQVGAVTSPQAMQSPLVVEWTR